MSGSEQPRMGAGGNRLSRRRLLTVLGAVSTASGCLSAAGVRTNEWKPLQFVSSDTSSRITPADASHKACSEEDLRSALDKTDATVWVPGDARIEITQTPIAIAPGVTLASSRGLDGRSGGIITMPAYRKTVFKSTGSIRVSGLRVKGPETEYFDPSERSKPASAYDSQGFELLGKSEIDHCELWGWPTAAVSLGNKGTATRSVIHHNYIHHNQMATLGYGIFLRNGEHRIEWNCFDRNRHSIAAFGHRENGYEARFNVIGPHAVGHAFDMHGLRENISDYDGPLAGKYLRVSYNAFTFSDTPAVVLRGRSAEQSWARNNWAGATPLLKLNGKGSIFSQKDGSGRFDIADNEYGSKAADRGYEQLKERGTVSEM